MKKIILNCLITASIINHTHAQMHNAFLNGILASLFIASSKTGWDYATGTIEKSANPQTTSRFKRIMHRLKHNIIYLGLPTALVTSSLCYAFQINNNQSVIPFWKAISDTAALLLPTASFSMIDSNNSQDSNSKEMVDRFIKGYHSVKNNMHSLTMNLGISMMYIGNSIFR